MKLQPACGLARHQLRIQGHHGSIFNVGNLFCDPSRRHLQPKEREVSTAHIALWVVACGLNLLFGGRRPFIRKELQEDEDDSHDNSDEQRNQVDTGVSHCSNELRRLVFGSCHNHVERLV